MALGDHVCVRRLLGYTHHGIDCGDGTVIHFSGEPGGGKKSAIVCVTRLSEFLSGGSLKVREYGDRYSAPATVARARSRLGESGYDLFGRNCEHFAEWCCTGRHSSRQVNGAASSATQVGVVAGTALLSGSVIAAAGAVEGVSAAGVMSGLATAGLVAGGGAALGPAVIGALPAVAAVAVTQIALADSESLPHDEREARRDGRLASVVGAAAGTAGGVAAIGAAGTTAGLGAAGISSGLAAIGAAVTGSGGGMLVGAAAVAVTPAALAAGLGIGVYALSKWLRG